MTRFGLRAAIIVVAASILAQVNTQLSAVSQVPKGDLEGVWDGQSSTLEGAPVRVFPPGALRLTFSGARLLAVGLVTPEEREVSFQVNTNVVPKQIDYWTDAARPTRAVYEVKDDVLMLAVNRRSPGVRPSSVKASTDNILLSLKRRPAR